VLVLLGGVIVVVGSIAAMNWYNTRYALVSLGVHLRRGDRYARKFDALLADSDFITPGGRIRALHRIAKTVAPDDLVEGFVHISHRFKSREDLGRTAENLARAQMQRIGIAPEAVNVANQEGMSVMIEAPTAEAKQAGSDACVLAILVTVRQQSLQGLKTGDDQAAREALLLLSQITGRECDALYFYYAPNAAEPLDSISATRLFLDLRATTAA
jgi:hypothetical protein